MRLCAMRCSSCEQLHAYRKRNPHFNLLPCVSQPGGHPKCCVYATSRPRNCPPGLAKIFLSTRPRCPAFAATLRQLSPSGKAVFLAEGLLGRNPQSPPLSHLLVSESRTCSSWLARERLKRPDGVPAMSARPSSARQAA